MTRKRNTRENNANDQAFKRAIRAYYTKHGRHDLPWRATDDPYNILVSEVMLQQTQVPRVREKYAEFLRAFPTVRALAAAPLGAVLRVWQGLGYNRRAKLLHECAKTVVERYDGAFPRSYEELLDLPGIGPYTAGAVMAFAYNDANVLIETNIRTVYLFHYFPERGDVPDREVLVHIERTLDRRNPRMWYAALMDYGSFLKKEYGNHSARSRHHVRQSVFKGSDREIRGAVLRALASHPYTKQALLRELATFEPARTEVQLQSLIEEGLVVKAGRHYDLP